MKIQSVRGTRDFYPEDMAVRQWLTDAWRAASRRAGFVEVDGPELEPLELYTEKSGPEIAEQLYWLTDKSDRRLALRPEFTPTLARMIAARQAALPEPIRWFNVSRCFRYERAQKGRLREFFQWNVDLVGVEGEIGDAECISVAVDALRSLGLTPQDVTVKINDRRLLGALVRHLGIAEDRVPQVFAILDKRDKVPPETLSVMLAESGLSAEQRAGLERMLAWKTLDDIDARELATPEVQRGRRVAQPALQPTGRLRHRRLVPLRHRHCPRLGVLHGAGVGGARPERRAPGRSSAAGDMTASSADMGGKPMPACGFGCGDVVLGMVLAERGKKPPAESPAEYFVVSTAEKITSSVIAVVRYLRDLDHNTQFDLKGGNMKRQMKKAAEAGAISWSSSARISRLIARCHAPRHGQRRAARGAA